MIAVALRPVDNIPLKARLPRAVAIGASDNLVSDEPISVTAIAGRAADDDASVCRLASAVAVGAHPAVVAFRKPVPISTIALRPVGHEAGGN